MPSRRVGYAVRPMVSALPRGTSIGCVVLLALLSTCSKRSDEAPAATVQGTGATDARPAVDAPPAIDAAPAVDAAVDATATVAEEIIFKLEAAKLAACACNNETCIERVKEELTDWLASNSGRFKGFEPSAAEDQRGEQLLEELRACRWQAVSRSLPSHVPWLVQPVKVRLDGRWGVVSDARPVKVAIKATKRVSAASPASPCVRLIDKDGVELDKGGGDDPDPALARGASEVLTLTLLVKRPIWEETTQIQAYLAANGCATARHEALSNVMLEDIDSAEY